VLDFSCGDDSQMQGGYTMNMQHARLMEAMTAYDRGEPGRIQHFVKVYGLASTIGMLEGLDQEEQFVLETAAIVHDIGIKISKEKYGNSNGKNQELEGPAEADKMLRELGGYTEAQIERVKYLIAHHHTYNDIGGMDYQILVEADFLVNLYENESRYSTIMETRERIFRTGAGKRLLDDMFAGAYE